LKKEKRNAITVKRSRRSRCISENTKEDIRATDTIGLTIGMANRFDNRWQKNYSSFKFGRTAIENTCSSFSRRFF
jgi:hypothetical protein